MASIFKKGGKWWCRLKGVKQPGVWGSKPTPFAAGEGTASDALRYAVAAQKQIDARALLGVPSSSITVATWAERWLGDAHRRALASYQDMVGHVNNHILPALGPKLMVEVRAKEFRDFVRGLKANTALSPKTVYNIVGTARTMFNDAEVDEVIVKAPKIKREDRPQKLDKDPLWRQLATYERSEVVTICTSPRIPPERRVLSALKALAGLRHGEAAGVRWSMWFKDDEPLAKLAIVRTYVDKATKTKIPRMVPVHPELARLLAAWRELWEQVYGDPPTPSDYIVPTRNRTPISPTDAQIAFKADLAAHGLRVTAGDHRARGGHDLRAWFISAALEDGANTIDLYAVTHTKKKDVEASYNRQRWAQLCTAVSRLQIALGDDPLALATGLLPSIERLRTAYNKRRVGRSEMATPTGFEPVEGSDGILHDRTNLEDDLCGYDPGRSDPGKQVQGLVTGPAGPDDEEW